MANITQLPNEIFSYILGYEDLNFNDIVNFSLTCKRLYKTVNDNNVFWRRQFFKRWPALKKVCNKYWDNVDINIKQELIKRMKCRQELSHYFSHLHDISFSKKYLAPHDLEGFNHKFCVEEGAHPLKYYYFEDELFDILKNNIQEKHINLTDTYYARWILPYMKHYHLRYKWQAFIKLPAEQQLLEWVATFQAQWCQAYKRVSYSYVTSSLDNIAEQALELLKELHPNHSIFSMPAEQFIFWKNNNIDDNHWNKIEAIQIIEVLSNVIFQKLGFKANYDEESLPYENESYSFIDCVLQTKCGTIISLAIIFENVARRLGIRCDLVSFPNHFFLAWKQSYNTTSPDTEGYHYIDVLSNGSILSKKDCPKLRSAGRCPVGGIKMHKRLTPVEVLLKLTNNSRWRLLPSRKFLEDCWPMELKHMVDPYNQDIVTQLGYDYLKYNIYARNVRSMTLSEDYRASSIINCPYYREKRISESLSREQIFHRIKIRNEHLKYAVGMIVEYRGPLHNFHGVIIAWNISKCGRRCKFDHINAIKERDPEKEIILNSEDELVVVLYEVLSSAKTWTLYQDSISPMRTPIPVNNLEIGRYFCRFEETHYIPNRMLEAEYPDDSDICTSYVKDLR